MSTGHLLMILAAVWAATAACVFLLGWAAGARAGWDRAVKARARVDRSVRAARAAALEERAGRPEYLAGQPFAGAQDPSYRLEGCNHAALMADALAIAERQMDWRDAHRESEAIWAEIEADPGKWRHQP